MKIHISQFLVWFLFSSLCCIGAAPRNKCINVGVILDLGTLVGMTSNSCLSMAVADFYAVHDDYRTRLVLHTRDSEKDVVTSFFAALELLKHAEVQVIIGPQKSTQAEFVMDLGDKTHVPIVSFSATSPSLSTKTPYFIQMTPNDSYQLKAIAAIIQAFGWKQVVPVYEDTDYGNGVVPYLIDTFQEIDVRIPYRSVIPPSATEEQILQELYKLLKMQTRVFLVHMSSSLGSRFFLKVNEEGLMSEGTAWIITDGLTNLLDSMDYSVISSMEGVLGIKPYVPSSIELHHFKARLKRKFRQDHPNTERSGFNTYCLYAYDTIWAVATVAERVYKMNFHFQKPKRFKNSTPLAGLGISQMGPKLLKAILTTEFKGLSGEIRLVNRQLQPQVFQILNVIGKGERPIGFWMPTIGISQGLDVSRTKMYSTSKSDLRAIIWPGGSTTVPKGWVIPTAGKKLRVAVPVKDGFNEFVKVEWDPSTNATIVTGYCIEIFNSVMEALPYAVPYEFIPFQKPNGENAGDCDDLVYQVYLQEYDAAVGDITITANRSSFIDFSLPFTIGGVSMIVPSKYVNRKNMWIFFKPMTWDLWLLGGGFFIFIGVVVWVFEYLRNSNPGGPPIRQIIRHLISPSPTLFFTQGEKDLTNVSKFILSLWGVLCVILGASYIASLTSMLTVQSLQLTAPDVKDLIKNGDYVGYQKGSFVAGILKQLKFDESKLRVYNSLEEYDEALTKGSQNGGVAAIMDEITYVKLLLEKYCNKYTMVGLTHRMDGFGFVFQRGSPLVADVSRAISSVLEGERMVEIEKAWFGRESTCPEPSNTVSSNSLSVDTFLGLFLILGIVILVALIVSVLAYIHRHSNIPFWKYLRARCGLNQEQSTPRNEGVNETTQSGTVPISNEEADEENSETVRATAAEESQEEGDLPQSSNHL